MVEPLLALEGLESGYGDVQVLWGVDLEVRAGEIVCLIGSNGAGKTTLLKTVAGLIRPRRGAIRVDGRAVGGRGCEPVLRAGVTLVPEGRRLFPTMSVQDNLMMGAYLRSRGDPAVREDLERVLEIFPRLRERARQDAGTLSGGEQQMCALGRGIMSRPRLLMIDELSLGLAPRAVELLSAALLEVNRGGISILLVEQDVMTALDLAHRGYVIDRGRVAMSGEARELAGAPEVREAYVGVS